MKHRNKWIMGSAIGLAAIAVAVDHTRHRLPEPAAEMDVMETSQVESPCGLGVAPCGMTVEETPCGLGAPSPCSL